MCKKIRLPSYSIDGYFLENHFNCYIFPLWLAKILTVGVTKSFRLFVVYCEAEVKITSHPRF